MGKRAFAIACIPDDIECLMAGTLVRLREAGCETHTMNIAGGAAGPEAEARNREAYSAAFLIGAIHHESLVDGFDALYEGETTARLCAIFRETPPDILLIQWPSGHADEKFPDSRPKSARIRGRPTVRHHADAARLAQWPLRPALSSPDSAASPLRCVADTTHSAGRAHRLARAGRFAVER